jgi:hypothetical protein
MAPVPRKGDAFGTRLDGKRRLHVLVDALLTLAVAVGAAYALGVLFECLWAPTPTAENSSPPPEAFLFFYGALIGFVAVILVRVLFIQSWLRRRRHDW